MVFDLALYFSALWFDLNEVRHFLVVGYVECNGDLPGPLLSGLIQYLKWQLRCAFSIEYLVKVQPHLAEDLRGARSGCTSAK